MIALEILMSTFQKPQKVYVIKCNHKIFSDNCNRYNNQNSKNFEL